MNREDARPPVRQATRVVNAFQFAVGNAPLRIVGPHLDRGIVLLALCRAALRPSGPTAPSLSGLALSLHRPPESIRRAGLALVEAGLCVKAGRRIVLAPDALTRPDVQGMFRSILDELTRFFDRWLRSGLVLPQGAREAPEPARLVAALDIYLSVFELTESRISEPMVLHVLGAVTVGNAAPIVDDPELSQRYAYSDTVPPDDVRSPVAPRAIADLNGFAYSTIWRHAVRLENAGMLRRTDRGYLLGDVFMNTAQTTARSIEKVGYVRRVLADLALGR